MMYLRLLYRKIRDNILYRINKKAIINRTYRIVVGKKIDWENPTDLNEKINWLKLYGDTSQWSRLADKYAVREFIREKGLEDTLIPLYGHWDDPEDIDFASLPEQFVLKTTHGSGDAIVVRDKSKLDIEETKRQLRKNLNLRYGLEIGEFHYLEIKPQIVCEELLDDKSPVSSSVVDYKVWCFNGKPYIIMVGTNRRHGYVEFDSYDLNWNFLPGWNIPAEHYGIGIGSVPRPKGLERLLEIAEILADGFPQVRVDLYEVDGKVYFGEMTFTSMGGYMTFYAPEILKKMGEQVKLPGI